MSPFRRLLATALVALLAGVGGCDLFGPSGPGTLEATVSAGEPLGGLVLELRGPGITGFEARGDTRVFSRSAATPDGRHRVVLVGPEGSPLRFGITVEDLGADKPTLLVVSAVGPGNRPSNARGIEVRVDG